MNTFTIRNIILTFSFLLCHNVATTQIVRTIAGNGSVGYSGDHAYAINAAIKSPSGVAADANGNLYISDANSNVVRKVDPTGIITTYAGSGIRGLWGDGGPATAAQLYSPMGLAVDSIGNLYIADNGNQVVRKVDVLGNITTVVGNGYVGFSGDGGPATAAKMNGATAVTFDRSGNMYVADGNTRIRKITRSGIISTVAGSGNFGFTGDGGLAIAASLAGCTGIAVDPMGNLYIADYTNNLIRKVNTAGIITTYAGLPGGGYAGDGGHASAARLSNPRNLIFDNSGNLYIIDEGNQKVRMINPSGIISTYAGTGGYGYSGNGSSPLYATFANPYNMCINNAGIMFIADMSNHVVREVMDNTTIDLTQSPGNNICANTIVTSNASVPMGAYKLNYIWKLNNVLVSDTTLYVSDTINSGDKIAMYITDPVNGFVIASDSTVMTVYPNLTPVISVVSSAVSTICQGTNVLFNATSSSAGTAPAYRWTINGINAGTTTSLSYTPTNMDVIQCFVTSNYICSSPLTVGSISDTMFVNPYLTPSVTVTSSRTTFCEGDTANIIANPVNGGTSPMIYWNISGTVIDSGNTLSYKPANGDIISCSLHSNYQCLYTDTAISNTLVMTVNPIITSSVSIAVLSTYTSTRATDSVIIVADVTGTGTTPSYQWFLNRMPVVGARTPTFDLSIYRDDTVYCVVTNGAACVCSVKDTSNNISFVPSSLSANDIPTLSADEIRIFPNPNNGAFILNAVFDNSNTSEIRIEIYDILGKVVYSERPIVSNSIINEEIIMNTLTSGTYILRISNGSTDKKSSFVIKK